MIKLGWPYLVRVTFPGHVLHNNIVPAARCEQFSEQCWDLKGKDADYILPLNRAAVVKARELARTA